MLLEGIQGILYNYETHKARQVGITQYSVPARSVWLSELLPECTFGCTSKYLLLSPTLTTTTTTIITFCSVVAKTTTPYPIGTQLFEALSTLLSCQYELVFLWSESVFASGAWQQRCWGRWDRATSSWDTMAGIRYIWLLIRFFYLWTLFVWVSTCGVLLCARACECNTRKLLCLCGCEAVHVWIEWACGSIGFIRPSLL